MQCYKAAFILSLLFCPFLASAAGVAIAGTRVIYNEQSHEADITVKNTNPHDPVLIQSWVDDLADNNKSPFIVTPPLFRLDAGDSNDLRVLLTSAQLAKRSGKFVHPEYQSDSCQYRAGWREHSAICY